MEAAAAELKLQYAENRKRNNTLFIIPAGLCIVYLLSGAAGWIGAAAAAMAGAFLMIHKQEKQRKVTFKLYQIKFYHQLNTYLKEQMRLEKSESAACGYREWSGGFKPVVLTGSDDSLIIREMCFEKQYIYHINNYFWYLYYMKEREKEILSVEKPDMLIWRQCGEDHQTFLRTKALKWNCLSVMEYYIYQRVLECCFTGAEGFRFSMADGIDSLRKEKMYSADLSDGSIIYLNGKAMEWLNQAAGQTAAYRMEG